MISRVFFISVLFITTLFSAQIYENYPKGQDEYFGGNVKFYKDFHQVIVDQNLKPCDNPKENYIIKLLISPEKKIKYVKDDDSVNIAKNKCAYDLARTVVKYMKGWKPAVVEGKEVNAVASFTIIPKDLFESYVELYKPENSGTIAEFKGGINEFRMQVLSNIDMSKFTANYEFRLEVSFVVGVEGKIEEVELLQSSGLKEFDLMVVESVKNVRSKWKPATISEIPVKYRFRLPLVFQTR